MGAATFTVIIYFEWSRTKVLITPQLKELPGPTFGFKLPLLCAIMLPKFIRFRWTVMEKWSLNVFAHICTCSCDVLYPLLSFCTHNSSLEGAMELKFAPSCSFRGALSIGITFCQSKNFRFWPKTINYSPWFFFGSRKKVVRKVYHSIGNEQRNLMALVSVA